MRVLVVKTSSMGDVVHALPAVSDMLERRPGVEIDWLVEAPFAAIPALHPGVRRVWPMAWRKWRRRLLHGDTWRSMRGLRAALREARYDLVLDLQGLLKSAAWARLARAPVAGYDRRSAREPLASWLYARRAAVPRTLQAIERNRRLAAEHLGYPVPDGPPRFGIAPPPATWQAPEPYAVLIPNASRPEKLWPQVHWTAVGRHFSEQGATPVVLWGSAGEQEAAQRIADGCAGVAPPFLRVDEMAAVLAHARAIVGLDTGFTHLGAAFGVPTVGVYCDHDPGLAGITGPGPVASIGGKGQRPALADVLQRLQTVQSSSTRSAG